MKSAHVLLIEDDPNILLPLVSPLKQQGFLVSVNTTGKDVITQIQNSHPKIDIVLCDIVLPYANGLEITQAITQQDLCPVILISTKGTETDRIMGLAQGADDYVVKPLNPIEVLLRVQAVLKRQAKHKQNSADESAYIPIFPGFKLHKETKFLVRPNSSQIQLTDNEKELLLLLKGYAGRICSRQYLAKQMGMDNWTPADRSIDVLIGRLRKKFIDNPAQAEVLVTVRGKGYMLATHSSPAQIYA